MKRQMDEWKSEVLCACLKVCYSRPDKLLSKSLGSLRLYVFKRKLFCSPRLHYLIKNAVKTVIF